MITHQTATAALEIPHPPTAARHQITVEDPPIMVGFLSLWFSNANDPRITAHCHRRLYVYCEFKTQILIDGQTLTPGGQVVAGGTAVSLAPDASDAVIAGTTRSLVHDSKTQSQSGAKSTPLLPVFTVGGSTLTADSATHLVIDGHTLTPVSKLQSSTTFFIATVSIVSDIITQLSNGTSKESLNYLVL